MKSSCASISCPPLPVHAFRGDLTAEVSPSRLVEICRHLRDDVELYFSNRTWLTLGCGGFLLTRYVPSLEELFDNDGALDLYVASFLPRLAPWVRGLVGLPPESELARLYRNDAPKRGKWLLVRALEGKRDAQGAEITVTVNPASVEPRLSVLVLDPAPPPAGPHCSFSVPPPPAVWAIR